MTSAPDNGQERAIEFVGSLLKFYGDYRAQKEREAYVVTVLFLGAAGVLLTNWHPASTDPPLVRYLTASGIAVAAALVAVLVCWQIKNLRFAARMVGACVTVTSRWLTKPPDADAIRATTCGHSVEVPHDVACEFNKQSVCAVAVAQVMTPIVIVAWGVTVAVALQWRG
jgi:hypothetical protein